MPLSKFILGTWEPTKHAPNERREIQFINEDKIWYDIITTSNGSKDGYEEETTYQFIGNDSIRVQGKRDITIEEWKLSRTGANLEICFQNNDCVVFARERIKWWWIFATLTAAFLAFYLSKKFNHGR